MCTICYSDSNEARPHPRRFRNNGACVRCKQGYACHLVASGFSTKRMKGCGVVSIEHVAGPGGRGLRLHTYRLDMLRKAYEEFCVLLHRQKYEARHHEAQLAVRSYMLGSRPKRNRTWPFMSVPRGVR